MSERLDPSGAPVEIDGVVIRTPGLEGEGEGTGTGGRGTRGAASGDLDRAMANEGVATERAIELRETREVGGGTRGTRGPARADKVIEMEVRPPRADEGQAVLASDGGVLTWNLSEEETAPEAERTRGGKRRTYVVPRFDVRGVSAGATRGPGGALLKKVLRVVTFKLFDPIGEAVGDYFAGKWEAKKRPYRFRPFTPEDYVSAEPRPLEAADWQSLGNGRALLMIHGTVSRAHTAFGNLPKPIVEELHRRYEGRVFAFDHFTLSEDPRQNVDWFCSNLPDGQALDVDIICHSRGGLVSRYLAEQQSALSLGSRSFRVGRIVFAAVPNGGTILADANYMNDFVDAYTNLFNYLPDTGVVEGFEAILTIVKQLAVGALRGLEGLQSMNPSGDFLRSLNAGEAGDTRYYALAANYEPSIPGLKAFALDRLTDKIFKETNDLVVPTDGVFRENGRGGFPISDKFVFEPTAGVGHTNFFGQKQVGEKVLEWLA